MKTNLTTILLFLSIGVMGQTKESKYTPVMLSGIYTTKVVDTIFDIENSIPVRTIQKVYALADSTKYTEHYKTEWNTKNNYWDFKSVTFIKGSIKTEVPIRFINRGIITPSY